MLKKELIGEIKSTAEYFKRSTKCLEENDSAFTPKDSMFSVANHVAHAAQTIDWFMEGAFRPEGFDLDFAKHEQEIKSCTSLGAARQWFDKSVSSALEIISNKSEDELKAPISKGPVMGGLPRYSIISAITDHSAHHRGALTVYSRLLGKVPAMPYME